MKENRFVIISPTYNSAETCRQTLLSLAGQSYKNWELIVIDDCSTDGTSSTISREAINLRIINHVNIIHNYEKKWEIENTLIGLSECNDDDIVCRLDMDDYLTDLNAFEVINQIYAANPTLDALWTSHRWFDENGITAQNISANLPAGADPYTHPWVSSHFKTFRKRVLNGVSDENFRGSDGQYFKRIGDQAFMLPALKNSRAWAHLPIPMYAYRCSMKPETFQTDDAKFQAEEARFLRARGFVK